MLESSGNLVAHGFVAVMVLLLLAATSAVVVGFRARRSAGPGTVAPPRWQLVALAAIVSILWVVALSGLPAFLF